MIIERIERVFNSQRRPQIEAMLVALNFYAYGIAGMLLSQRGGEPRDADKTAKQIYRLITGNYLKT